MEEDFLKTCEGMGDPTFVGMECSLPQLQKSILKSNVSTIHELEPSRSIYVYNKK